MLPDLSKLIPSEPETYEMTHPVHSLQADDFELLVGLIYQRQGYRVTMPAGLSGGHGGDFVVQRKSEKLLVQCKKFSPDYKVPVDRVKELHEAAVAAGVTRGVYVASCGFSWDARNFAKTKGVTVINAKTLDLLLTEAQAEAGRKFSRGVGMGAQAPEQSEADAPALPSLRSADGRAQREQRSRLGLQPAPRMQRTTLRAQSGPPTKASYCLSWVREHETEDHSGWPGVGRARGPGRTRTDYLPFDGLVALGK